MLFNAPVGSRNGYTCLQIIVFHTIKIVLIELNGEHQILKRLQRLIGQFNAQLGTLSHCARYLAMRLHWLITETNCCTKGDYIIILLLL